MSVSHSSFGFVAVKFRCTKSSHVGAFFRFFTPFLGPGRPFMSSWRMILKMSLLLTISPCSISNAARIRNIP